MTSDDCGLSYKCLAQSHFILLQDVVFTVDLLKTQQATMMERESQREVAGED